VVWIELVAGRVGSILLDKVGKREEGRGKREGKGKCKCNGNGLNGDWWDRGRMGAWDGSARAGILS